MRAQFTKCCLILGTCISTVLAVTDVKAAFIANGTLSTADGSLLRTDNSFWTGATLAWSVDLTGDVYTFTYIWDNGGGTGSSYPDLSHMTVEVSDNFVAGDVINGTTVNYSLGDDGQETDEAGGLYGLKWQASAQGFTATIITKRVPVWGDILLKDGQVDAYNAGRYLSDTPVGMPPLLGGKPQINYTLAQGYQTSVTNYGWLAVPDTIDGGGQGDPVAPEPTSLALAGFAGIGMAVSAIRRRRQSKAAAA